MYLVCKPDEGRHKLIPLAQLERSGRLVTICCVGRLCRECAEAACDAMQCVHRRTGAGEVARLQVPGGGCRELRERYLQRSRSKCTTPR